MSVFYTLYSPEGLGYIYLEASCEACIICITAILYKTGVDEI